MEIKRIILQLIYYSKVHFKRNEYDVIYLKNTLFALLNIKDYTNEEINKRFIKTLNSPKILIDELLKYLNNNIDLVTKIISYLLPSNKEVEYTFKEYLKYSPQKAINYLYNLHVKNNYINNNNKKWKYNYSNNYLDIVINITRPEQNNKINIVEKNKYPKCKICKENIGYFNNSINKTNLRVVPLKLNKDNFFIQFSPYYYFNHHFILVKSNHTPMCINKKTFLNFVTFVNTFKNYFIGSNSDIPLVGGSILNHLHYQCGLYDFPIMFANSIYSTKINKCKIEYLNWFCSCIKVTSSDSNAFSNILNTIKLKWDVYSNNSISIYNNEEKVRHNSITPVVKKIKNKYIGYIFLRNNSVSKMHPYGIFHSHINHHNIKKEGIGLFELMGYFILPSRLERECLLIKEYILNKNVILPNELIIHRNFINRILKKYKTIDKNNIDSIIKNEIGLECINILKNVAVFKNSKKGNIEAIKFINSLYF